MMQKRIDSCASAPIHYCTHSCFANNMCVHAFVCECMRYALTRAPKLDQYFFFFSRKKNNFAAFYNGNYFRGCWKAIGKVIVLYISYGIQILVIPLTSSNCFKLNWALRISIWEFFVTIDFGPFRYETQRFLKSRNIHVRFSNFCMEPRYR